MSMPPLINADCFESSGPYIAEVDDRFDRDVIETSCSVAELDRKFHSVPAAMNSGSCCDGTSSVGLNIIVASSAPSFIESDNNWNSVLAESSGS